MLLKTKPYALVNTRRVTLKEPWDRKSGKRSTLTALPDLKTTFVMTKATAAVAAAEAETAEEETAEEEAEVTQMAASSALTPNRISTSPCWIRLIQHQTRKTGQHTCQQIAPLQVALKPDTRKQYFPQ
jgi:1,6-anhydro-N-acetylmuramate kinase